MGQMTAHTTDPFRSWDSLVTTLAYVAGTAAAAAFVALATAILVLGSVSLRYVFVGPAQSQSGLYVSLSVLAVALPVTAAIAIPAAACAAETSIGGAMGSALLGSLGWSLGMPPVVIGVAVFFVTMAFAHETGIGAAVVALVVLNLPNATARFIDAYACVPAHVHEAAAAAGASSVHTFFDVVQRRALRAVASASLTIAGQMLGETSAVLLASGARGVAAAPLSMQIWQFASNPSLIASEASSCILLVLGVAVCMVLAKMCAAKAP